MKGTATVLLVNQNERNLELLAQFLGKGGYTIIKASTLEQFDRALNGEHEVAAALVDLTGFDQSIWQRCELLRSQKHPFLIVSPRQSAAIQQASLSHGARGVMIKPLVVQELLGLISNMLEEQE